MKILNKATYGIKDKNINVLGKVINLIKDNNLIINQKYNELFGDPIYGKVKELIIKYTDESDEIITKLYKENEKVFINNIINKNHNYNYNFSGFIWSPVINFTTEILEQINSNYPVLHYYIYEFKQQNIYDKSILDIYTSDNINPDKVKNIKLKAMNPYQNKYVYFKFYIQNPQFRKKNAKANISTIVEILKKNIREKYKKNVKNYIHDIIIHISDNYEQTKQIEEIMKKYITNRQSEFINLKQFLKYNFENNIFSRVDVLVRKYSIEQYIKNHNYNFNLYIKMQARRTGNDDKKCVTYINNFKNLINSIKNNGFNNNYPVKYSLNYLLRDGSHRLSYLLILKPTFIKIEHLKWDNHKSYNIYWFKKKNFSNEELNIITNEINNLNNFLK